MEDIVMNFSKQPFHEQDSFSRIQMLYSVCREAMKDPTKADMVSAAGDLSGTRALKQIRAKMRNDKEGRQILEERPRIKAKDLNFSRFENMPKNTLGYHYWTFMAHYNFSPDERPLVKYVPDMELAYIHQRYKETHDFTHVLMNMGIEVEDELAVKAFEMIQTGLPMTALALVPSPFMLSLPALKKLYVDYLPWITQNALNSKFYMNIYWEKVS